MTPINTEKAPSAIGTYSQAVQHGPWVFLSGQIPLQVESMELVAGDIRKQISQVFDNLSAVCQAAGGSLSNIIKLTIYLTDLNNFSDVNDIMAIYFNAPYPARAALEVSALPRGAAVEMDGIMIIDN